ncbi:MAG: hypothetical protein M3N57_12120 [Actinomycetota bacterium]|nr:hypothetical protein [Actinomycetota bacterium]
MAEKYTSLIALVVDRPVEDVGAVVDAARVAGDVDRTAPVGTAAEAQEVAWGGRMGKAVVRAVEGQDGAPMLRAETYIGAEGLRNGMRRHAQLLLSLARQLGDRVRGVRDLSAAQDHETGWLARVSGGDVQASDAIHVHTEGQDTYWVHSHGAARFDIPDLELYGVNRSQLAAAQELIRHVHDQLLRAGLRADLTMPDGTPIYLVPVVEAWSKLPMDWPGVGRADESRPGHDGPRATLSVLHKRRFGRYRKDIKGVVKRLASER